MNTKKLFKFYNSMLKGFLAMEQAVLITVVVAALVGMSFYIKRALSGKWRDVGDSFGFGRQYEPGVTEE